MLLAWFRFETPGYLALLALLPLLVVLSFRSLAGLGPVRRWLAIAARCAVALLMVLALSGLQRTRSINDLSVTFLVDRSRSVPADLQARAFNFIADASRDKREDDRVGVVAFDGAADVEQTPSTAFELSGLSEAFNPDRTNIAGAARLALALLPSDTMGRLVLLSDGNENVGSVMREAEQLRAAGIPVDVVPLKYAHENEVVVESLRTPPLARIEETIQPQIVLRSQQRVQGEILLYHNDKLLDLNGDAAGSGVAVELQPGLNRPALPEINLPTEGPHRFRAEFRPRVSTMDTIPDNNEGRAFTIVSGPGKVLILTTAEDAELPADRSSAKILASALEHEQIDCEVAVARDFTYSHDRLLGYTAVVLNDVPANDLRAEDRETLAVHVRELGGGLVMIGGPDSFGAGGWMGSPVEEVMPVSFDIKHIKQFMQGALVLVMHACEVEKGNFIGERCAIEAVKTLSSRDYIGILAWNWQGGTQGHWVVPLQPVGDRTRIINAIKNMSMGDLPFLEDVMRPGVDALMKLGNNVIKHMIVISDFDPQRPSDKTIRDMQNSGITCSTIAIGYGGHFINEGMANDIATKTGGRFYRTHDLRKLPQIFIKESREVKRSLVQEVRFRPELADPLSPIVSGLVGENLAGLGGYVLTTKRPMAQVPIVRATDTGNDPILAHWQVGLGRTVAFTSGLWPRWGADWLAWSKFTKFWAQTIRWVSRQSEGGDFDVSTSVQGGKATIRVEALASDASAITSMEIEGQLVRPDNSSRPIRLTQTAPGRFESEIDVDERGNYIFNLEYAFKEADRQGEPAVHSGRLQTGLAIAYSPEFGDLTANEPLLEELRQSTRGRALGLTQTASVFDRSGLPPAEASRPLWETLVYWTLLAFLLDVAIRRIAINPIEVARKTRDFVAEIAGRRRPQSEAAAVLTTLKGTRERLREAQEVARAEAREAGPAPTTRYTPPTPDSRVTEELGKALGGATEQDQPVVARPTGRKPAQSESDYTSRLLEAKRRAREKRQKDDDSQDN